MKFANMQEAQAYLNQFIPVGIKQIFSEDIGLRRAKQLLAYLDNPQNKLKVIHIAGTSGKGSTVQIMSELLLSLGCSVGLSVSPHILDLRERFQINGSLITEEEFCTYLSEITSAIDQLTETKLGKPTFFEITVTLAYYIFWKKNVDYAVIETGLGGMYDGTNVVTSNNKICVITKIGLDHTQILGNTLSKIAAQKAGIIQKGNIVFTCKQEQQVNKVFNQVVSNKQASLYFIQNGKEITGITTQDTHVMFDFQWQDTKLSQVHLALQGLYQAENAGLALAVVLYVIKRDGILYEEGIIRNVLQSISIPGRYQSFTFNKKEIVIDGAHNPQKMSAFVSSLKKNYPGKKFHFLIAFKVAKDYRGMLKKIISVAEHIGVAEFAHTKQGILLSSVSAQEIASSLEELHFKNYSLVKNVKKAISEYTSFDNPLIITGSLYFIAEVYPFLKEKSGK